MDKHVIQNKFSAFASKLDNFNKGGLFEEYVVALFNKLHFKITDWKKSEKLEDSFLLSTYAQPDIEFLLFLGRNRYRFAVECKWRNNFNNGVIKWASSFQICSYEDYEYSNGIPVFVVIGIGGEPSNPEKLFVTPLCNIAHSEFVYEHELIPFNRHPRHKFYYDPIQLALF